MLWKRTEEMRLEAMNDLGNWSITTYKYRDRNSVHIRLNGRLVKYETSESAAIRYAETNSERLP